MNKLLSTVGLAVSFAMVTLLAGCSLYFGDHSGSGGSDPGGANGGSGGGSSISGQPPGYMCNGNSQCAPGCFCDQGKCSEGGFCSTDKDCGTGFSCDTQRSSCIPIPPPAGLCRASVTCGTAAPNCDIGTVPLVKDGCYVGTCAKITACEAAPACAAIQHEQDCTARTADCRPVVSGFDCTKPDGTACHDGDTNCTCAKFAFASCVAK